jgi:16S rRNA (uracil1498-N3)-methyltransferase
MPRFFVERLTHPAVLPPDESRHAVRVLRLRPGDPVVVFDDRETWEGRIESVEGGVRIRLERRLERPLLPAVIVAAAVPKGARLDWMIEKLAELGVAEYVPVRFARSVAELGESKRKRLEKVAVAAAKQSGAPVLRIAAERPPSELPADACLASPAAEAPPGPGSGMVVVGPEGGLTPVEEARFPCRIRLGSTILRIETAAVVAAAARLRT